MIIINGYDVQNYFKYDVEINTVVDSSLSFTAADGTVHECILGYKYKLALSSKMVDTATASAVLTAIVPDTFSVTFINPAGVTVTRNFKCKNKPFSMMYNFSDTSKFWQFDLTFEEV